MKIKQAMSFCLLCILGFSVYGQVKTPAEFLGYPIGSRFTPHWKIVNYFEHVAAGSGAVMKIQRYGETNEGRPLFVSFISSAENISRLEEIRKNNLRLTSRIKDGVAIKEENAPAIVWLSYNVHGNETSSSEAAMLTLHALVDTKNSLSRKWLQNTVVVIDPCINPDGRDRYVNWFNSITGKTLNPIPFSREHREPWPGGRTNHFNFDLNRDWAWQTQKESKERMVLYNQWFPQVHVDYHEQGFNEPYYFAPAAQPFHEVITPWQSAFQTIIGKNNAKYFDEKGWLYFTKEYFDLFYPSYGDTYPTYNGAIGMTYEQGGSGAGGAAVITDEEDTLTLYDRVIHHHTTGLSTIEISSIHAAKLINEFRKYFNQAVTTGYGDYKTYVVRNTEGNEQKLSALKMLLDQNGIVYAGGEGRNLVDKNGSIAQGSFKGFNYLSRKDESFSLQADDLVISAVQPASAMVKVLMEPRSVLTDSATYDITAWALPYVYGVEAFALKDKLVFNDKPMAIANETRINNAYGYVFQWQGTASAKLLGQLFQKGIRSRYAEQPFEVDGIKFGRGSVIILKKGNRALGDELSTIIYSLAASAGVRIHAVSTGFVDKGSDFGSDKVRPLSAPNVVLLTGEGVQSQMAGEVWHLFEEVLDYPLTQVNLRDISNINWSETNVLIMPSGNYSFLNEKTGVDRFKEWIRNGGKVIAMESAVAALAKADFGIKSRKEEEEDKEKKDEDDYAALKKYEDRERESIPNNNPGAIFSVELDNTHPLAYGYPDHYYTLKLDDRIYDFMNDGGWNVGVIKKESQVAGFVGSKLKEKLNDALVFGVESMGKGSIVYFADDLLFRSFWENGKLMFCNAVFLVGQ